LKAIATDASVTCAKYAKTNNFLKRDGWKQCRRIAKSEKKLQQMFNQAKLMSYQHDPFWKFGVLVPCNHAQAVELDKANGNTKCQDTEATESSRSCNTIPLLTMELIWCHLNYDVKDDG
jgi:hypothetical protein